MIQRDQTYVLGPNQDSRLATVTTGQVLELQLPLDSDAPFILRGRAMRCKYDASRRQTALNHLLLKWSDSERNYQSQDFVRQSLLSPYFGQLGNSIPVWPNVTYPRNGIIRVQIKNDGAEIDQLSLYFRGVKLFLEGSVKSPTYPATFGPLPFVYPQTVNNLPVTCGNFSGATAPAIRQNLLNSKGKVFADADFVMRAGQAGLPFSATPVNEVFIRLLDEDEKPYSNDAVAVDVLFGNSAFGNTYPAGTSAGVPPIGGGPNSPGVFFPELYVPKNHSMYYELSRNDSAYGAAVPVNYPLAFIGQKVFAK